MLYPLTFKPLPMERVWGGTALARYGKTLPTGKRIGETWEISDRDEAQSTVANGPWRGRTLHELVAELGVDLLGTNATALGRDSGRAGARPSVTKGGGTGSGPSESPTPRPTRFPLLVKLLDARERLSLQVHPPAAAVPRVGGEPKTEMWYILEAEPGAGLFAGLRRGVTRDQFAAAIKNRTSTLENLIHRLPVSPGDAIFIPSGRLHALDAGLLLVEIQENSDTTFRVYDWGRVGLDGKPRPLHVEQSLACIDFTDWEPTGATPTAERRGANRISRLVDCDRFEVRRLDLAATWATSADGTTFHILTGLTGEGRIQTAGGVEETIRPGQFVLVPAALGAYRLEPTGPDTAVLLTTVPARQSKRALV